MSYLSNAPGEGVAGMEQSIYDPALIAEQLVGETAVQTVSNKTLDNTTSIDFDTTRTGGVTQGQIAWDESKGTMVVGIDSVSLPVHYEAEVFENRTGSTIPAGTVLAYAGTIGVSGKIKCVPFINDGSMPAESFVGFCYEDTPTDTQGVYLSGTGLIGKLNTSSYTQGQILYASETVAGGYQTTTPVAPIPLKAGIAVVTTQHAVNGQLLVRWTSGTSLGGDSLVELVSLVNRDTIVYNSTTGRFENETLANVATSGDYNDLSNKPDLSVYDSFDQYANSSLFPAVGDVDVVYVAIDTGYIYRWNGSGYTQMTDQTAIWGQIAGSLSAQTDLQNALNAKLNKAGDTATGLLSYSTHPTFTTDTQIVDKKYVDDAITAGGGYTDEQAQDAVGNALTDSANIDFTYNDVAGTITADIIPNSIDGSLMTAGVQGMLVLADSSLQPADIGTTVQPYSPILDATTASFTTADESKLDGIEAGAEVNNISDINATDLTDGGETGLHIHDLRYYTETETDAFLAGKSDTGHTHAIADVTGLQTNLDGKVPYTGATESIKLGAYRIGMGVTSPLARIDITGTDYSTSSYQATRYSNDTFSPTIRTFKARGTEATPTQASAGDNVNRIEAQAHNGTAFVSIGTNDLRVKTAGANITGEWLLSLRDSAGVLQQMITSSNEDGTKVKLKLTPEKGIIKRSNTQTTVTTLTPSWDTDDNIFITAQASNITIANPTGTPVNGQTIMIRIKFNAVYTITYGTDYRAFVAALPTAGVAGKTLFLGLIANTTDSKVDTTAMNEV